MTTYAYQLARAREVLGGGGDDPIVAAVRTQLTNDGQTAIMVFGIFAGVAGRGDRRAVPLAEWLARSALRLFRGRKPGSLEARIDLEPVLLIFRKSRLDVHERKPRDRPGSLLASYSYSDVSYGRHRDPRALAIETFVRVDDLEIPVSGHYERDLRKALAPLGVALDPIR